MLLIVTSSTLSARVIRTSEVVPSSPAEALKNRLFCCCVPRHRTKLEGGQNGCFLLIPFDSSLMGRSVFAVESRCGVF
jgi:hypothetical protein